MIHNDQSLIIDPFITGNRKCEISVEQLLTKNISTLILTHGHYDHIGDTLAIIQERPDIMIIAPFGIIKRLETQ